MTSENRPRRAPAVWTDAKRNPGFAVGAFGLSAWAYIGMSHTIADYEGEALGWALGVAYEALVIGLAWEGRRRADLAHENDREVKGHRRWLVGAIVVGFLSGALAAWHGWTLGEGIFAVSRAVAPVLAAVAVHLFFQAAASARAAERRAQRDEDREKERVQTEQAQEAAVLDMLDAVRLASLAPADERAERIDAVNAAVGRVHRHVPASTTAEVTAPHLESERTIRDVIQEAATLAGEWMPATITGARAAAQNDGALGAAHDGGADTTAHIDGAEGAAQNPTAQNDARRTAPAPTRRTRRAATRGAPKKLTGAAAERAHELRALGHSNPEIGAELGVSKDTVRRLFKDPETPPGGNPVVEPAPAPHTPAAPPEAARETIQDMEEARV